VFRGDLRDQLFGELPASNRPWRARSIEMGAHRRPVHAVSGSQLVDPRPGQVRRHEVSHRRGPETPLALLHMGRCFHVVCVTGRRLPREFPQVNRGVRGVGITSHYLHQKSLGERGGRTKAGQKRGHRARTRTNAKGDREEKRNGENDPDRATRPGRGGTSDKGHGTEPDQKTGLGGQGQPVAVGEGPRQPAGGRGTDDQRRGARSRRGKE